MRIHTEDQMDEELEREKKASNLQSVCEAYVREKPTQALLIALTVGILIGLLARR
jgi:ElaB/YqjD/DUF883 family membrane-anchored ribosome-binding protein